MLNKSLFTAIMRGRQSWIDSVESAKKTGGQLTPQHSFWTRYCYNSLNQVNIQKTPDAGVSKFYYDRLGRLTISQNAKQSGLGKVYSYTLYDSLGRITQVGQITGDSTITDDIAKDTVRLTNWFARNMQKRSQITQTVYDTAYSPIAGLQLTQQNLRNRVSYTQITDTASNTFPSGATYYSYDIHGNVDTLVQDFGYGQSGGVLNAMNTSGNRFKKIVYNYDLISGKVNQVSYQPGQPDAYYHRYSYDAENRLTDVYTGRDSTMLLLFPEREAHYSYYKHGPLMQTILGQLQVQKQDYAYTLQEWLKGINPTMGGTLANGTDTTEAFPVTQDVYGFSLHYYKNDYRAIGYSPQATSVLGALTTNAAPLYNGNIAAMAVNISQLSATRVYNYHYDQLNRIVAMDMYNGLNPNTGTFIPVSDTSYKERVSYDPNGNILGYLRNGDAGKTMDSLNYKYYSATNKLSQVTDNVPANKYSTDIDNQVANNYTYDATGNMISAASDTITNITWNVYGKIATITKNGKQIKYTYDPSGNRITKQTATDTTAYVRDATGNVMSVYYKPAGGSLVQSETHLYGSSRLGMTTQHLAPDTTVVLIGGFANGIKSIFTRGEKFFELSNHLGNVLATVSDRRIQVDANSDGTVDSYKADIVSANDYYPFGMLMPGRKYSIANTNYRYGFNGKELDKETSTTTTYDYGFRIYNPALGKFLSVDPLIKKYPELTPYQFASNTPIQAVDLDGAESMFGWSIGLTSEQTAAAADSWNKHNTQIVNGTASGVRKSVTKFWTSITHPWQSLKSAGAFVEEVALDQSAVRIAPTPRLDAMAQDFKDNVINGNGFTRLEYFSELGSDALLAKGLGKAFTVTKGMVLAERVAARTNLATAFYKSVGGNVRDVGGINLSEKVSTVGLNSNTKLYQWSIEGKLGDYFSPTKEAKNLGLPQMPDGTPAYFDKTTNTLKPRTLVEVNLPSGTELKGLKSTTGDIKPWDGASGMNKGGDVQIYSPQVKTSNPTITPIQ